MTRAFIPVVLALLIAGCGSVPTPVFQPHAPLRAPRAPISTVPEVSPSLPSAPAPLGTPSDFDPWPLFRRIGERGGLVKDFRAEVEAADSGYSVQLVPGTSQERADKAAKKWAPDARQIFVGWGFWKRSWIGFVRHGYYSAQKDQALMLDFALSRWAMKKTEESGENYRDAAAVLQDVSDGYRYKAKLACDIAKANGYVPAKLHVAALLNFGLYGPGWVFLDDRDWSPSLIVHAETGAVVKSGPMMEAAKLMMAPHQKDPQRTPSPAPTAKPSPAPTATPSSNPLPLI